MIDPVQGDEALIRRLRAVAQVPTIADRLLNRWQMRTVQLAKARVPKRTGNLQRSIHPGSLRGLSATVEASAEYAAYIEYGTRAHIIRPRTRRALAWNDNPGARRLSGNLRSGFSPNVFARLVRHPGTSAQPFLGPSAREALDELDTDPIVRSWNEAA